MRAEYGRLKLAAAAAATGAALALLIVAGIALVLLRDEGDDGLSALQGAELGLALTPLEHDAEGVPIDPHFVLTSIADLDLDIVRAAMRVSPEVPLEVTSSGPREHHLVPSEPLEPGAVYRFTFVTTEGAAPEASWAFQVHSPLRVASALPANETAGVPLDSGIEITFSHDGVVDPESFVEITPRPEGHFERHKRTLVFVPRELAPETIYTVRVKPGLTVAGSDLRLEEEQVIQFETGNFKRGEPSSPTHFDFLHKLGEWGTSEAPYVSIVTTDLGLESIPIEVFAYPSLDMLIEDLEKREELPYWAPFTRNKVVVDTSRLSGVLTFDAPIEGRYPNSIYSNRFGHYIRIPEVLPAGYYLLQATYKEQPVQAWLQITDIATYLAVSETTTLVWVNNVATAAPIAGAEVRLAHQAGLGSTDAQGITEFGTPDELRATTFTEFGQGKTVGLQFLTVADGSGQVAVVPVSPNLPAILNTGRCGAYTDFAYSGSFDHWNFATSDRPIYQPNDTVRFWGIALPRDGGVETELTAELFGYRDGRGEPQEYARTVRLEATDMGTFTGEYRLEGASEGYHTLSIRNADGDLMTSLSFQVMEYVKPAYRIVIEPERKALFAGETARFNISAEFFDGTPLPGLELAYTSPYGRGLFETVTTGPDGHASISFVAEHRNDYAQAYSVSVSPLRPEEGEVSADAYFYVFPSSVDLTAESGYADGLVTVTGEATRIDPSLFTDAGGSPFGFYGYPQRGEPYLTGPIAGQAITAEITEQRWVAIETGERYDFINKITRKTYRYETQRGQTIIRTAVTGPDGTYSFDFPGPEDAFFEVQISAQDGAGRTSRLRTSAWSGRRSGFDPGGMAYITTDESGDAYFNNEPKELGDETTLIFRRGLDDLPAGGANRYLFYEGQRGIRHYAVQDSPVRELTFEDRHIPSAVIGGVWFNGFTYFEAQYGPTLFFNPESRRLTIEVRALQQSYRPGDTAELDVRVTDAQGNPAQAEVNLAAVDEAVFAVRDFQSYQQDILRRLYQPVPSGIIRTYASHQYPPELVEPGGRGGDGGGVREDFPDIALFETVRTDSSGRARVSFEVPDNLTSWRVTAFGFTGDLKAGKGSGAVIVSLPFFVDVSLNTKYLATDKPQIRLSAWGTALQAGANVRYTVEAPSLGSGEAIVVDGAAMEETYVPLPALSLGEHKVTVRARSGDLEDAVARTIQVVESRLALPQLRLYEDAASARLEGSDSGRTTVTLLDGGRARYYQLLQGLLYSYGDRVDQQLARSVAAELLRQYFGEDVEAEPFETAPYLRSNTLSPMALQRPPGIAILPYADPDPIVTARIAAVAPSLFGSDGLGAYLSTMADAPDGTLEGIAVALYGLAALDEPVLTRLQAALRDPLLGWRGRLYAALGLHELGDDAGARAVLDALTSELGEETEPWYRLRAGEDADDSVEATALAAILAAGLRDPRAEAMLRYVQENPSTEVLLALEQLQFLEEALPRTSAEPVEFTYRAGDLDERITLRPGEVRSLSLSPSELAALDLDVHEGTLAAVLRYDAPMSGAVEPSPDLGLRRTVLVDGQPATSVPAGALVEVRIEADIRSQAPWGCYQVTDVVPSGLRVVTTPALFSFTYRVPRSYRPGVIFPYASSPDEISFCLTQGFTSATYYARASSKGEYTWEPAFMANQRAPALIAFSEGLTFTVQ